MSMLFTCQPGFERLLAKETEAAGLTTASIGRGWLRAEGPVSLDGSAPPAGSGSPVGSAPVKDCAPPERSRSPKGSVSFDSVSLDDADWCFAHTVCPVYADLRAGSVNALANALAQHFEEHARGERFEAPWPLAVFAAADREGLGRRAASVEGALRRRLQKRMARVARLATASPPRMGFGRGLFAPLVDFDRASIGFGAWLGGQRRMADDAAAPSRSFLKAEEAYGLIGRGPEPGESVADLGAAPGGWSYSAARRGARVLAVDNGPLKGAAQSDAAIEHLRADAFRFRPRRGECCDWLFCDMVEDPYRVLSEILAPWIEGAWCRRFVVNLKFGRADPLALLEAARAQLRPRCARWVVRHLFHDREEITLTGVL